MTPIDAQPTREQAWETLTRYTKGEALLRHALAVEASTAWYARRFGEDEELWRVVALLHDFDYEIHPTLDQHPQDGAPILRDEGYPDQVIEAVLSHAEHLEMPRDTALKKTLFACDELSGFVHACGLVRPTGLDGLEPKSVRKKLKQPSFAAGVHRDEVYAGAEGLGLDLDEHIRNVGAGLQPIAPQLGLRTAETAGAPGCRSSTSSVSSPATWHARSRSTAASGSSFPTAPRTSRTSRRRSAAASATRWIRKRSCGLSIPSGFAPPPAIWSAARSGATRRGTSTACTAICSRPAAPRTRSRSTRSGASAMHSCATPTARSSTCTRRSRGSTRKTGVRSRVR